MNRWMVCALGIILLSCSYDALGQHGGHGGGRGGAPSAGGGSTADPNLRDFSHALAVQATPDQAQQFEVLAKNTELARKQAQELVQLASKAKNSVDFSQQTSALKDAVEDAQGGNKYFVKSFTKSQKDGLKEVTKKLDKADSEVGKQRKILDQQVEHPKADSDGLASTADKLEKALADFQEQQLSLGKEMGIPAAGGTKSE